MAISAKDIILPPQSQFEMLQSLIKAAGPNRNNQAHILLLALIGDGINTRGQIIACAERLGFKRGHTAKILESGLGADWRCVDGGTYVLID